VFDCAYSCNAICPRKIDAPVWNVGDKWVLTGEGSIEVVNTDQNSYALKFSDGICVVERQGHNTIIYEKPTINRIHFTDGGKRKKYVMDYQNF